MTRCPIITRGGYDWSERYPAIVAAARRLPSKRFVIDGEGVVDGEGGAADFALLHSRQHDKRCYLIGFDSLQLGSKDLRELPLSMRKALLATLLEGSTDGIVYSEHLKGDGPDMFAAACGPGLEGKCRSDGTGLTRQGRANIGSRSRTRRRRRF